MTFLAQIVGFAAFGTLLLSYQMKKRKHIIAINAISSILYVLQYFMLRAFEGAVIDSLSAVSTVVAHKKNSIKKYATAVFIIMNIAITIAGLALYKNIFSLFPIAGALLQTDALWITDEKKIRLLSFLGTPFWIVYNLVSCAYASALGSIFTLVSIGIAIWRYDFSKRRSKIS